MLLLVLSACSSSGTPDDSGPNPRNPNVILPYEDAGVAPDAGQALDAGPAIPCEQGVIGGPRSDVLAVVVTDALDAPLPDVLVSVWQGDLRLRAMTDGDGCARFEGVGPEETRVTVLAEGFAPHVRIGDALDRQTLRLVPEQMSFWSDTPYRVLNAYVQVPEAERQPRTFFMTHPITRHFFRDAVDRTPSDTEFLLQYGRYNYAPLLYHVDPREWLGLGVVVTHDSHTTSLFDMHLGPLPVDDEAVFHTFDPTTRTDEVVRLEYDPEALEPGYRQERRAHPVLVLPEGGFVRLRDKDADRLQLPPSGGIRGIQEFEHPPLEPLGASLALVLQHSWNANDTPRILAQHSRGLLPIPAGAEAVALGPADYEALLGPIEARLEQDGLHLTHLRTPTGPIGCRLRLVHADETSVVVEDFSGAEVLPLYDLVDVDAPYYLAGECLRFSDWTPEDGEDREAFADGYLEVREGMPVEVVDFGG